MFNKLFKRKSWTEKTISNITNMLPNIEQLSLTSQLVKMSVERIQESVGKDISIDSQYCIYSFELGAMQHALSSFCDLSVFDSQQRFMFLTYPILFNEVKEYRITSDVQWEVISQDYHRACADKYKSFRQLGYDSDKEKSSVKSIIKLSSESLIVKLIQQLESSSHILAKNGSVEKR